MFDTKRSWIGAEWKYRLKSTQQCIHYQAKKNVSVTSSANAETFNIVYYVFTWFFHSFVAEMPKNRTGFPKNEHPTAWIHFRTVCVCVSFFLPAVHCSAFNESSLKSKRLIIFGCFSWGFISFISGKTCRKHNSRFFPPWCFGVRLLRECVCMCACVCVCVCVYLTTHKSCLWCKYVLSPKNHQLSL